MSRALRIAMVAVPAPAGAALGMLADAPAAGAAGGGLATAAALSLLAVRASSRRTARRSGAPAVDARSHGGLRPYAALLEAPTVSWASVERVLRPIFRPIAERELAARGIDLDRDSAQAREILGDELWSVVHADRPGASGGRGEGVSRAALRAMLERLEALAPDHVR